jgi:hypothetical protein
MIEVKHEAVRDIAKSDGSTIDNSMISPEMSLGAPL